MVPNIKNRLKGLESALRPAEKWRVICEDESGKTYVMTAEEYRRAKLKDPLGMHAIDVHITSNTSELKSYLHMIKDCADFYVVNGVHESFTI